MLHTGNVLIIGSVSDKEKSYKGWKNRTIAEEKLRVPASYDDDSTCMLRGFYS